MSLLGKRKITFILLAVLLFTIIGVATLWIISFQYEQQPDEKPKVEVGPVYETEEFTVNIANTLNHFIKVKFAIELSNEKVLKEIEKKLPIIQDAIIMNLSGQDLQSLSSIEGKEKLKETLLIAINNIFEEGHANKIYFKNIIFQ
jgi:flagellar basal body-associated protein FliL